MNDTRSDSKRTPHVYIVSQSLADEVWSILKTHGVWRLMDDIYALIESAKEKKP